MKKNKSKNFFKANQDKLILAAVFLVIFIGLIFYINRSKESAAPTIETVVENQEKLEDVLRRKIDGQIILESEENIYPIAIMVENAVDAWPLSGLDKADLVIEAITESSIPRFVAIYATGQDVDKIGPVRSARPYYLDWIEPLNPVYMHVGGAPEALASIKSGKRQLIDLDQFFHYQYYWRDNKWRYAPHNVYTSSELLKEVLADKELTQPIDYPVWQYKDDLEPEQRPEDVADINIFYTQDYYKVTWKYNQEENNYIRYQRDKINKMSDGEWIKAKNIIVQVNKMKVIDEVGRKKINTTGEGQAWIFRDGEVVEAKWQKNAKKSRTKYFDQNGTELKFNAGKTWIEVVPDKDYLSYQ